MRGRLRLVEAGDGEQHGGLRDGDGLTYVMQAAGNRAASLIRRRAMVAVDATALIAPRTGRGLHRFANPGRFLRLAGAVQPWLPARPCW